MIEAPAQGFPGFWAFVTEKQSFLLLLLSTLSPLALVSRMPTYLSDRPP